MLQKNEIKIGTRFKTGKHTTSEVVDIVEVKSIFTGEIYPSKILARSIDGISSNIYETSWFTVQTKGFNI